MYCRFLKEHVSDDVLLMEGPAEGKLAPLLVKEPDLSEYSAVTF